MKQTQVWSTYNIFQNTVYPWKDEGKQIYTWVQSERYTFLYEISDIDLYECYKNILKNKGIEEEKDFEGQLGYISLRVSAKR